MGNWAAQVKDKQRLLENFVKIGQRNSSPIYSLSSLIESMIDQDDVAESTLYMVTTRVLNPKSMLTLRNKMQVGKRILEIAEKRDSLPCSIRILGNIQKGLGGKPEDHQNVSADQIIYGLVDRDFLAATVD